MATPYLTKYVPIKAVRLSMADLQRVYERLTSYVEEECEKRLAGVQKPDNKTDDEFETWKEEVRSFAFKIDVTIRSRSGVELVANDASIFSSSNLPEGIETVFFSNTPSFETYLGQKPINRFSLLLDFSKPPLLDSRNPLSNPTANNSHLNIEGDRDSWMASIEAAVMEVLANRKNNRGWLHRAYIYDLGMLLFAIPTGFYVCWRFSGVVNQQFQPIHDFVAAAVYLYLVVFVLWMYRFFFEYTKWAFPLVELASDQDGATKHRAFWVMIVIGLIVQAIWSVLSMMP